MAWGLHNYIILGKVCVLSHTYLNTPSIDLASGSGNNCAQWPIKWEIVCLTTETVAQIISYGHTWYIKCTSEYVIKKLMKKNQMTTVSG